MALASCLVFVCVCVRVCTRVFHASFRSHYFSNIGMGYVRLKDGDHVVAIRQTVSIVFTIGRDNHIDGSSNHFPSY